MFMYSFWPLSSSGNMQAASLPREKSRLNAITGLLSDQKGEVQQTDKPRAKAFPKEGFIIARLYSQKAFHVLCITKTWGDLTKMTSTLELHCFSFVVLLSTSSFLNLHNKNSQGTDEDGRSQPSATFQDQLSFHIGKDLETEIKGLAWASWVYQIQSYTYGQRSTTPCTPFSPHPLLSLCQTCPCCVLVRFWAEHLYSEG